MGWGRATPQGPRRLRARLHAHHGRPLPRRPAPAIVHLCTCRPAVRLAVVARTSVVRRVRRRRDTALDIRRLHHQRVLPYSIREVHWI